MSLVVLALRMPRRDQRVALLTCVVATYAFFTAVPTKMTAYGYPVSPVVFLAFGAVLETTLLWLTRRAGVERASPARWLGIGLLGVLALWNVSPRQLGYYHSNRKLHEKPYGPCASTTRRSFGACLNPSSRRDWAVFNCREHEGDTFVMFYTPYVGYDVLPTREQLATLHARGVAVAVFYSPDLPDYLAQDPAVFKDPSIGLGWAARPGAANHPLTRGVVLHSASRRNSGIGCHDADIRVKRPSVSDRFRYRRGARHPHRSRRRPRI